MTGEADFKTEIKYSTTDQKQLTPTNSALPLINILNVRGTSQSGTPTTGLVFLGTEFSRQGNYILVGRDGKVVARFRTAVRPDDPKIVAAIEKELAKRP